LLLNPRALLLFDAIGAALTSIATAYLLAGQRIRTGLPLGLLYGMTIVAACFVCFDLLALRLRFAPAFALQIIGLANLAYCLFVIVSLYQFRDSATILGVAYFCIEISLVVTLAVWEWIVASRDESRDALIKP
jgi:hypothetical protein